MRDGGGQVDKEYRRCVGRKESDTKADVEGEGWMEFMLYLQAH